LAKDGTYPGNARHTFENDFYLDNDTPHRHALFATLEQSWNFWFGEDVSQQTKALEYLEHANPKTVPMMLNNLHKMASECPGFKLFAL
jgi:hypothetical protein